MKISQKAMFSLIKSRKQLYYVDIALLVLSNTAASLMPLFMGLAIGSAVDGSGDYSDTTKYLVIFFSLGIVHAIFWHTADYWIVNKILKHLYTIRTIAYETVWKKQYSEFVDKSSSKTAASANKLNDNLKYMYDSFHYGFLSIAITYTVLALSVVQIAWQNSAVYAVFFAVAFIILINNSKKLKKKSAIFADKLSEFDGKVFDGFSNFTNVFSFNIKNREIKNNFTNTNELYLSERKFENANTLFWMYSSIMLRVFLWAAILTIDVYLLHKGTLSTAEFAASLAVLINFTSQFWELAHHVSAYNNRAAAFDENYQYLFKDKDIVEEYYERNKNNADSYFNHEINLESNLEFKSVIFSYPDSPSKLVLDDINFKIAKNEKIGIVGKSGGGKSTLVKLLLGFYDADVGEMLVDGKKLNSDQLNMLSSYVPQDTTLFQETLGYNIAYASSKNHTQKDIVDAAKKAHAHDFIIGLSDGYNTLVGERGIKLSLGQRQRIALARAFLKDTDLLILDEATSSLDSKTEKDIQEALEELWKNKTVIAIAHRLSTLNNVDRILVVDGGKIVESGTKDELLKLNGVFAELWNHQKNGLIE